MPEEISQLQYQDVRKQIGHYKKIDYHPYIRAAGTVVLAEGLEDCFKDYKLQDGVEALKSELQIRDKDEGNKVFNYSSRIGDPGVKSCLKMNKRSPFQSLIAELKDTAMNSYWKKEVGKIPDPSPSLPDSVDPVLTTFGRKTKSDGTAAELVNPAKTAAQVMVESRIGHALYRKSHSDYYPSEQVNREYVEPFNRKNKYGKETQIGNLDSRAKRSMRWFNPDVVSIVSNLQADFFENTQSRVGRMIVRADVAPLLNGRTFGKVSERGLYGVSELLSNSSPNTDKQIQREYLEHISMLRLSLKKRSISFTDLYQTFIYYDRNKTKTMTMEEIYRILGMYKIYPNSKLLDTLLHALNLIKDGKVSYKDVTDLLSWKCDFPLLPKLNASYAGLGTEKVDVPCAVAPPARPYYERESLGDQKSVAAILSPNILTQCGLSHMDFFKIRKAHEVRTLFEDIGVHFPGNSFNVLWTEGLKRDCTGGVCIETFRGLLDQLAATTYEEIPVV